jgi:hypothetical protein
LVQVLRTRDIRSFDFGTLGPVETNADGKGNCVRRGVRPRRLGAVAQGTAVPLVIRNGKLGNVRITYRERGKADRVALIETLSISPGSDGLLAISGKGSLNEFPATVSGELGPLDALTSGRNIRTAIQGAVGALQVDVKGRLGRLDPLDGADLAVRVAHPDLGTMLKKLQLPVVLAGRCSSGIKKPRQMLSRFRIQKVGLSSGHNKSSRKPRVCL